jgi:citrate lyase synthetase
MSYSVKMTIGRKNMPGVIIRPFVDKDAQPVYAMVQNAIDISYRGVYPPEAIEFFKEHHSMVTIQSDAINGYTVVAEQQHEIIGSGTLLGNEIRRVYIRPPYQNHGVGNALYCELEREALRRKLAQLELHGSLVSKCFWELLGFAVVFEGDIPMMNNQKLHYYRMCKKL